MTLALLLTAATGAWADDTYTVVGSNSDMFGTAWDPTNTTNDMTKNGDGTYSITYTNVYLDDDVQYKVVKNHSWDETYPDVNRVINIAEAGTYTVTIHFNPTTHEVYETMPGSGSGEPDVEVITNAASEQDLFTEASFTMPAFDATVSYTLVRDLAVQTQFVGVPTEPVAVKKDGDKFVFASGTAPTIALIDLLNDNAPIVDGVTYYFEKQNAETGDFEASTVNLLADAQPGTWRIVTTATADGPYDGTVRSAAFTLVEQYDLTVKPANDFSKKGLDAVTVGTETVTPDATTGEATKTGITPDTEVKLKAKRGYVIEKVEAKKHATK